MSYMTNTGAHSLSDYNSRTALIEVTGLRQHLGRNSNYTLKVPLSRMSQTMQDINRMGGKIASVTMFPLGATVTKQEQAAPKPVAAKSPKAGNGKGMAVQSPKASNGKGMAVQSPKAGNGKRKGKSV